MAAKTKNKPFTAKQEGYIEARVGGANQRDAAVIAGYASSSAAVQGCNLEKVPAIKAEIAKRKKIAGVAVHASEPGALTLNEHYDSPAELFEHVMNMPDASFARRYQAAKDLAPFVHKRKAAPGKKETSEAEAKVASGGRFKPKKTPLRLVGGGRK